MVYTLYRYSCSHCNATYVGESSRHFHRRNSERRGISLGTNRPCAKTPIGNIYKHFLETNRAVDSSNFSKKIPVNDTSIKVAKSILIHILSEIYIHSYIFGNLFLLMELCIPHLFLFWLNVILIFYKSIYMRVFIFVYIYILLS